MINAKINANGIQLNYHRTGGDKPPLILSHGITDNGLCWRRIAELLQHRYDVIMVDARGHGLSDKPGEGYTRDDHADDLAAFIQVMGLEKPGLMGHSMGANTSAVVAARHPELVSYAILEDPPWRYPIAPTEEPSDAGNEWIHSFQNYLKQLKALSHGEVMDQCREQNPKWDEAELADWAESKQQVDIQVLNWARGQSAPWTDFAAQINVPTLLITADVALSAITPSEAVSWVESANSQIQHVHIPNAGHNIRREQFDLFCDAVLEFVQ